MNLEIKDLLGTWRGQLESNTVDFTIKDNVNDLFKKSVFTIYNEKGIVFEWVANPSFIRNEAGTWDLELKDLECQDMKSKYLKQKVWYLHDDLMVIEFDDGYRVELRKQ